LHAVHWLPKWQDRCYHTSRELWKSATNYFVYLRLLICLSLLFPQTLSLCLFALVYPAVDVSCFFHWIIALCGLHWVSLNTFWSFQGWILAGNHLHCHWQWRSAAEMKHTNAKTQIIIIIINNTLVASINGNYLHIKMLAQLKTWFRCLLCYQVRKWIGPIWHLPWLAWGVYFYGHIKSLYKCVYEWFVSATSVRRRWVSLWYIEVWSSRQCKLSSLLYSTSFPLHSFQASCSSGEHLAIVILTILLIA